MGLEYSSVDRGTLSIRMQTSDGSSQRRTPCQTAKTTTKRSFLPACGCCRTDRVAMSYRGPGASAEATCHFATRLAVSGTELGLHGRQGQSYFDEAGLDVEVGPGRGSGSTAQLVSSKATSVRFCRRICGRQHVFKGMNITMVASIYRRNPLHKLSSRNFRHSVHQGP